MTIDPKQTPVNKVYHILNGIVGPRPIALVSTVDHLGNVNLSPFSFFNVFSVNPPIVVFSPSRRNRDNSIKNTHENILEVAQVAISIVDYSMVQQTSLTSIEFERGVNEFSKSGLTPMPSMLIEPPRVAEAPASLECVVKQVIPLGDDPGAGNLVICQVLMIHLRDKILDENGHVNQKSIDVVGRMGGDFYTRAHGDSLFTISRPHAGMSIGFDQIPDAIRRSKVLTGNDLGHLGSAHQLPSAEAIEKMKADPGYVRLSGQGEMQLHRHAQKLLQENKVEEAWTVLLASRDTLRP